MNINRISGFNNKSIVFGNKQEISNNDNKQTKSSSVKLVKSAAVPLIGCAATILAQYAPIKQINQGKDTDTAKTKITQFSQEPVIPTTIPTLVDPEPGMTLSEIYSSSNLDCSQEEKENAQKFLDENTDYSQDDKERILEKINKDNIEFLDDLVQLSYFEGEYPYDAFAVEYVLGAITAENSPALQEILSHGVKNINLLPYELIDKFAPNYRTQYEEPIVPIDTPTPWEIDTNEETINSIMPDLLTPDEITSNEEPDIMAFGNFIDEQKEITFQAIREMNSGEISKLNEEENEKYKNALMDLYFILFEDIHMGKSTSEECLSLENEMLEMGVRATFEDNIEDAKVIVNAFRNMKEKGLKLPKEVILMTPRNEGTLGMYPISDEKTEEYMPVFYAKGISSKMNGENYLPDFLKEIGFEHNSTSSKEGPVYHEIGHFLTNKAKLLSEDAAKKWEEEVIKSDDEGFFLAKEVSFYAVDSEAQGAEFVAEVFAGLMDGKVYSQRVMDLYEALGGQKIN